MKKKVFIDSDVFIDTIFSRKPHCNYSDKIISLCERDEITGFTSSLVIANIYYIVKKLANHKKAIQAISKIRSIIKVLPLTDKEIGESINAEFKDFEDGAQYFAAVNNAIGCLITRNVRDFKKATISILTPEEYLRMLEVKD